jgi:hypothetical protein
MVRGGEFEVNKNGVRGKLVWCYDKNKDNQISVWLKNPYGECLNFDGVFYTTYLSLDLGADGSSTINDFRLQKDCNRRVLVNPKLINPIRDAMLSAWQNYLSANPNKLYDVETEWLKDRIAAKQNEINNINNTHIIYARKDIDLCKKAIERETKAIETKEKDIKDYEERKINLAIDISELEKAIAFRVPAQQATEQKVETPMDVTPIPAITTEEITPTNTL